MDRHRKFVLGIVIVLGAYFLLNGLLWTGIMLSAHELISLGRSGKYTQIAERLPRLKLMVHTAPLISLGATRLPGIRSGYEVVTSSLLVAETAVGSLPELEVVMNRLWDEAVMTPDRDKLHDHLEALHQAIGQLNDNVHDDEVTRWAQIFGYGERLEGIRSKIHAGYGMVSTLTSLEPHLATLLGYEGERHYVVLLQNNMELRPTGGYLGSYADIAIDQGVLTRFEIQDIGWPNGQIKGYVKEPEPIRQYLFRGETPGWRLRDSNWEADYSQAAKDIVWFFNEGGIGDIDSLLAVNLWPVRWWLETAEPLPLVDYGVEVTADNFYQLAQTQAEQGFFPGSTQKGDFLMAVGKQILFTLEREPSTWLPFMRAMYRGLTEKQVMIQELSNPVLGEVWDSLNWSGRSWPITCEDTTRPCLSDHLYLNEANFGINKTNCCIDRTLTDMVAVTAEAVTHHLTIDYVNHNPPTPDPPEAWGGGYHNYLRIFVPRATLVEKLTINGQAVDQDTIDLVPQADRLSIGFLVGVPGEGKTTVELSYRTPHGSMSLPLTYELVEQKQSGILYWPVIREVNGQREVGELWTDRRSVYQIDRF